MNGRRKREDALILAIGYWSQRPWEIPSVLGGLRDVGRLATDGRPGHHVAANGLRDVIERSLERPSLSDLAPPLVGLDAPLYLAPIRIGA